MPNARPMSVNRRNLVWLALIAVAAIVGWLIGGWQIALGGAVLVLIVSELVERLARRQRQQLSAPTTDVG